MAASQRVQILSDKADELSLLAEYLKNPKLIDQLKADVKALNNLTDEESAKVTDARKAISQADDLKKALDDGHAKLAKADDAHRNKIAQLDTEYELRGKKLQADEDALAIRIKANSDKEASIAIDRKKLDDYRDDLARAQSELDKNTAAALDKMQKAKESNDAESARLSALAQSLQEKSDKLKTLLTE